MTNCPNCEHPMHNLGIQVDREKNRPYELYSCDNKGCTVDFVLVYMMV